MAKSMAKDIARDMVKDTAQSIANDIANQKIIETAKKLIEMNLSIENIAKATGLSTKQVLSLKKESEIFQNA
ncbi:MAG: hypothetical protein Q4P16_11725, partial [Spirochaetales bacterium]|nr:hypothetical protein [Spirochaetales bacterium]